MSSPSIAIRRASPADRAALERLAAIDCAVPPAGEVLIAQVSGEPQAAIEITTGTAIADPFRPTAQLVELLGVRADQLRQEASARRRLPSRGRVATDLRAATVLQ